MPDTRRILEHLLFWLGVAAFYTLYFGFRQDEFGQAFFFVLLLLPVTIGTTYAIVYWLVPRFLLTGQYVRFGLYLCYSILLSLHLELTILVGLYMTVADYQALFVNPNLPDLLDVVLGMYVVVFASLSLNTVRRWRSASETGKALIAEKERILEVLKERMPDTEASILIWVDREQIPVHLIDIRYVESQRDYLLLHTLEGRLLTKLTMAAFEAQVLDKGFVRIHRSYLIRTAAVTAFTSTKVRIGETELPIGRSYRQATQDVLEGA
jgi:L-lactate permease